jgi:tyrosinase
VPIPQFTLSPQEIRDLRPPNADRAPPPPPPAATRAAEAVDAAEAASLATRPRPDQRTLTPLLWRRFLNATSALRMPDAASPNYGDFVAIHDRAMRTMSGMMWGAHSMPDMGHDGRNFLAWHRNYLWSFELRLRAVDPTVAIPYWDWTVDRAVPAGISDPVDLRYWNVIRGVPFRPNLLPDTAWINAVMNTGVANHDFRAFQTALEQAHNAVHSTVGGTMSLSTSPTDPVFWLHHAFIDKLWSDWQLAHVDASFDPPNRTELMRPAPIVTFLVGQVLDPALLGYHYG